MSQPLRSLLSVLPDTGYQVMGDPNLDINGFHWDPQHIQPGFLFAALEREEFQEEHLRPNSLAHWREAVAAGAVAVMTQKGVRLELPEGITQIELWDLNLGLALMAKAFWEAPFEKLRLVGITGTNGKTTTCQILDSILTYAQRPAGVIGTIGTFYPSAKEPAGHLSNPLAPELFQIGDRMRTEGAQVVMMEVTSHGMDFDRNSALDYDIAIFTNLTQDHLDHHRTFEAYKAAKLKFFKNLGQNRKKALAVVNLDDPYADEFLAVLDPHAKLLGRIRSLTYGIKNKEAELLAIPKEMTGSSSSFEIKLRGVPLCEVRLPMAGMFNIYNALAAFGAGLGLEVPVDTLAKGLEKARQIDGRFEKIEGPGGAQVYIDYAHTPDALEKILREVSNLTSGKLYCVFGCGGDRDKTKRPQMGMIAGQIADVVIVTSDNPRTEDPKGICQEVLSGIPERPGLFLEPDRKKAIELALELAKPKDSILIAGKGHETYQIIGHERHPFSDRQTVLDHFSVPKERHYRAEVVVDRAAIRHNLALLFEEKAPDLKVMAVVKDDALGHGMVETARIACEAGVHYLGVATMSEALGLREAGLINHPILVFGERNPEDLEMAVRNCLSLQVQSTERIEQIGALAQSLGQVTKLHLKIDSGMGRYGVRPEEALALAQLIQATEGVELEGLMTHFAMSDEADKSYAHQQWARFELAAKALERAGLLPPLVHACNSGGYLDLPFAHGTMVRVGTLMTGVYPSKVCRQISLNGRQLKAALTLRAKVAFLKDLVPGDKVGYGMHFTAAAPMKVAVLPIGYGDGYPRLRNQGQVLIQGQFCPIIGGNSMDALMVDVSQLNHPQIGDEAVLVGRQGDEEYTAMMLAKAVGTVTYQVLSGWTPRIEKRWI
ncbi:MAG: UDP-N-acetylmuramoyl-L-alanyl-D-glutamate--2,6-diaminopimelate ligase [bacterium]|nr:UDP-N-acetylmuramoyl-L-alanyl-D-glutamate--2,6-diaminopimelate ligase [bacterium]